MLSWKPGDRKQDPCGERDCPLIRSEADVQTKTFQGCQAHNIFVCRAIETSCSLLSQYLQPNGMHALLLSLLHNTSMEEGPLYSPTCLYHTHFYHYSSSPPSFFIISHSVLQVAQIPPTACQSEETPYKVRFESAEEITCFGGKEEKDATQLERLFPTFSPAANRDGDC